MTTAKEPGSEVLVDIAGMGPDLFGPGMLQAFAATTLASSDLVIANPPFNLQGSPLPAHQELESSQIQAATVGFVANTLSQLKPGGRASILVPSGFLFARGDAQKLRRELVEQGQIEALVQLPPGLFRPYAHVVVWLLLLRKTGRAGAAVRVIDAKPLFHVGKHERDVLHRSAPCRKFEYLGPSDDPERDANIKYVSAVDAQGRPEWQQCPAWYLSEAELSGNGWNLAQWPTERAEFAWLKAPLGRTLSALGEVGRLDQCANVFGGTAVRATDLSSGPQPGAVPYVRIQDMSGGAVDCGEKWVCADAAGRIDPHKHLSAADVLLSKSGTIGKVALVGAGMDGAIASGGVHIIRADQARLDPAFLLAYLQCEECNSWLRSYANGAVILGLRLGVVKKLRLPLPPLSIQRASVEHCKAAGVDVLVSLTRIMDSR